jgi:hypothetical protein
LRRCGLVSVDGLDLERWVSFMLSKYSSKFLLTVYLFEVVAGHAVADGVVAVDESGCSLRGLVEVARFASGLCEDCEGYVVFAQCDYDYDYD